MLLISADKFGEFAKLNQQTSEVEFFEDKENAALRFAEVSGRYSVIDGTLICFYRREANLHLRIGRQEFRITDEISSNLDRATEHVITKLKSKFTSSPMWNVFRLRQNEMVIYEFKYAVSKSDSQIASDITPFIDEEDFDFMLFVHNVLSTPARRKNIWLRDS